MLDTYVRQERNTMDFKCVPASEVKLERMEEKGAEGIQVRWLIKKEDGAPNFAMRLFELKPNGYSPLHSHNWEHEVYILEGECKVTCEQQTKKATAGYVVFIPPNAKHQFANAGKSALKFICLVPHHK
jgi:quercetin dioxygenase-like cupin family protein